MAVIERVEQRASYRGLVIAAALLALGGLAALSASNAFGQLLTRSFTLSPTDLLALLPFAAWSYGLRIVRWHVLLRRLVPRLPLTQSLHTQLVGFAFATSPGRIAELYKLRMLERSAGLPPARSLPAVLVERLTDVAAFGSLGLVGGWLTWTGLAGSASASRWAILGLAMVVLAVAYQVGSRHWQEWRGSPAERAVANTVEGRARILARVLPGANRLRTLLGQLQVGATRVTSPSTLTLALACVVLGRLGDAMVIWQVARIVGHPVGFPTAMFLIAAAGLAGGLSLSPGGLGAAEATLAALTFAQGVPLDAALTITLVARVLIFWGWVVLGLVVFAGGAALRAVGSRRRPGRL